MEKITFDWQISGPPSVIPPTAMTEVAEATLDKKSLKRQHEFPFNSFQFYTTFHY